MLGPESLLVTTTFLLSVQTAMKHPAAVKFAKKLLAEITYIEGKSFFVSGNDVSFNFSLVPADLKWIASFLSELNTAGSHI